MAEKKHPDRIPAHLTTVRDNAINSGYRGGQSMMVKAAYTGKGVSEATREHERAVNKATKEYLPPAPLTVPDEDEGPFNSSHGYGR